jgi:hypothetical protein
VNSSVRVSKRLIGEEAIGTLAKLLGPAEEKPYELSSLHPIHGIYCSEITPQEPLIS